MIRIRHATPVDRAFIASLTPRFADFELPAWRSRDDVAGGTARRLDAALDSTSDRSILVIAEDDAGVRLGFAWYLVIEDFYSGQDAFKISEIAVVRDGTGAGAALMAEAERLARERGCKLMVLNVMEHNAHARSFYERHGYAAEYTMMAKRID